MGTKAQTPILAKPAVEAALRGLSLPFVKAARGTLERERRDA